MEPVISAVCLSSFKSMVSVSCWEWKIGSSYGFGPPVRNGRKPVELEIRDAQERLGHASVVMTADTYGHICSRAVMTAPNSPCRRRTGAARIDLNSGF